ncbi:MAG: acyl-CoA dehydrogenase family protein, partial [Candidatus Desulforudis sp.]|nr:acyl-CoA dehydrogenase family protein [Desulforudis sp.]
GLLGLVIPRQYGGSGTGSLALALAVEEFCKYDSASGLILILTALPVYPIIVAGNEEQKTHYLSRVASGEYRCCFGLTEPGAGSDAGAISTSAVREGNGYVLNGEKCFISGGSVADFAVIFAKTKPEAGVKGVSAFIVPVSSPGFSVGRADRKMGVHGIPSTPLLMDDCRIPAGNRLGTENGGFKVAMLTLNALRGPVGARGLGIAEGAMQYAVEYTRNRRAFGKRLCDLEALQFMMADMAMQIEAARLLVYQASWMVDQGYYTREDAGMLSIAKCYATEMAVRVVSDSLQLMGGYGYMQDCPLERLYRDVRQLMIVEGTSQIQRIDISRGVLDRHIDYQCYQTR